MYGDQQYQHENSCRAFKKHLYPSDADNTPNSSTLEPDMDDIHGLNSRSLWNAANEIIGTCNQICVSVCSKTTIISPVCPKTTKFCYWSTEMHQYMKPCGWIQFSALDMPETCHYHLLASPSEVWLSPELDISSLQFPHAAWSVSLV